MEELLTPAEVKEILKLNDDELRGMRQRGEIPYVKLTRKTLRYRKSDIEALIKRRTVGGERARVPVRLIK
jgi:predicted site-specific integrase-resolvase